MHDTLRKSVIWICRRAGGAAALTVAIRVAVHDLAAIAVHDMAVLVKEDECGDAAHTKL